MKQLNIFLFIFSSALALHGAPQAELWARWATHDNGSTESVDHDPWQDFLDLYLVEGEDGINRVRYSRVDAQGRQQLQAYLRTLQATPVSRLNRNEQMAFWFNLYNAGTVELILENPGVESILDIRPSFVQFGPWDQKRYSIEGEDLSLNDVEHRILRPIWQDPRIHYGVNCASLGCPNLAPRAFRADNLEELLDQAARDYINHPRGVRLEGRTLHWSSIFQWYKVDFGGTDQGVKEHLLLYAEGELAQAIRDHQGPIRHDYDWSLNGSDR